MATTRRNLLQRAAAVLAVSMVWPLRALAAEWNKSLFGIAGFTAALQSYGAAGAQASGDIVLTAPDIAENGASVPVDILSRIPGTTEIAVFAEKNPLPFICRIFIPEGTLPAVSLRLRLAETTRVWAVAKVGGRHFASVREVKVVSGGCG